MRIYTVHERAGEPADGEGIGFVKEGFAWLALVFTVFWLAFHRLWLALVAYIVLAVVFVMLGEAAGLGPEGVVILSFALQFLFACEANDMRRWTLTRQGYREIAIVSGRNLADAEHEFFRRWQGPLTLSPSSGRPAKPAAVWPRHSDDHGAIGLFPKAGG